MTPAQDMQSNLGKIVIWDADGSVPAAKPFASQGGVAAQVWTLGHRNVLGLALAESDRLCEHAQVPLGARLLLPAPPGSTIRWPRLSTLHTSHLPLLPYPP